MDRMQQTVFSNLGQKTEYRNNTRVITEKHIFFPKYRYQEILNEFEMVDLHNKGKLSQGEIIAYLSDKYEWLNVSILEALFKEMEWEGNDSTQRTVAKDQFCQKYLGREKKLYHEVNSLKYYSNWTNTLKGIFEEQQKAGKTRVYFYSQIREVDLYYQSKPVEWMDIRAEYENHEKKVTYEILQNSHEASHPSFQIWLPAQKEQFFLRYYFIDSDATGFQEEEDNWSPQIHQSQIRQTRSFNRSAGPQSSSPNIIYGQAFLKVPIKNKMSRQFEQEVEITRNGKKVGMCRVAFRAEPNMDIVKHELQELKQKEVTYKAILDDKVKQYEYLQFLWGIKHKAPHKISPLDVDWMLNVRLLLIIVLGLLGVGIHILGRSEPTSLVIVFLLLRNREYVWLRSEKFLLICLTVASGLLDLIWYSLASGSESQMNFISLDRAVYVTFALIGCKVILFLYLLIIEKSLVSD